MMKKKSDIKAIKWILKYSKKQLPNIIFLVFVYGILAYVGVYSALISKDVIDSAVNHNVDGLINYSLFFGGIIVLQFVLRVLSSNLFFYVSQKTIILYRTVVFGTIIKKDYYGVSAFHSGELLNRLTSDVSVISDAIVSILPALTFFLTKLISIFCVLFTIDPRFTFIFFFGGLMLFCVIRIFKNKMKALHKKVQETEGKVTSFFQEIISNLLVVKVFSAEKKVVDKSAEYQTENYKIRRKRNRISVLATCGFSFVFSLAYMYGLIWGAFGIVEGTITYGTLTALLALITQIQNPISQLTSVVPKYYNALASAERLMEINLIDDESKLNTDVTDTTKLYQKLKYIHFDNITFKYNRDIVLENTSLLIDKGDFVAIMGISGIGKSTLTKLLMGVYPLESGSIKFVCYDGTSYFSDKSTRTMFSYVPQGNFLLSGTIRENVSFVKSNVTDDAIWNALEISCAADFVRTLPKGLDTKIGEKGKGFSEGQIQRIAIARAILTDRPVLILDEATSAIDEQTEKQILHNVQNISGKTCIIISHKKAATAVCNRHIQIRRKKIIETT